jgi:hypothetical protein
MGWRISRLYASHLDSNSRRLFMSRREMEISSVVVFMEGE